ncbi:DUF5050 domain-containing protein [Hydrogeniiclostridium mannosilyticum]|uniref:DUF5050 domain-containing protein n=1 Tax=Hydrogeniiclostridium mannosilyticum TaxID=2764322 RepID=UPI0018AA0B4F|nr:DUF5050 domain-containing protein [Hydrogeniiclostridium mannosilyticum]
MEKQKFKSILLLTLFSLAFILGGCSSNTLQGDSSNGTVVEAPASSYCKSDTHMYAPDLSMEGKLIDYNSEDGSFTTLLDNSTGAKAYFDSVVVYDGNLYCSLRQVQDNTGAKLKGFLLKVNLETKEYSQYDTPIGDSSSSFPTSLWQAEECIYYTAVDNGEAGIYRLNLKNDKIDRIYSAQRSTTVVGTDAGGELHIAHIADGTIYFYTSGFYQTNKICSVTTDGKNYTEYYEDSTISDIYVIENKIYTSSLSAGDNRIPTAINIDKKEQEEIEPISVRGNLKCHKGFVYGTSSVNGKSGLYRVPMDSLSAQPELVSDKGTKIIELIDDFAIISDGAETPNYFVTKVDGSNSDRYTLLFEAYQNAFGFSSASDNDQSSSESENSNSFSIPAELTNMFDKSLTEVYGENNIPAPLFGDGGSNCYQAPNTQDTMYYFSMGDDESSYLLAVEGPINLLIPGKDTATITELKELFGDSFSFNFSDNMGGYTASAQIGEYGISFGTFESEENATVTAFRISK